MKSPFHKIVDRISAINGRLSVFLVGIVGLIALDKLKGAFESNPGSNGTLVGGNNYSGLFDPVKGPLTILFRSFEVVCSAFVILGVLWIALSFLAFALGRGKASVWDFFVEKLKDLVSAVGKATGGASGVGTARLLLSGLAWTVVGAGVAGATLVFHDDFRTSSNVQLAVGVELDSLFQIAEKTVAGLDSLRAPLGELAHRSEQWPTRESDSLAAAVHASAVDSVRVSIQRSSMAIWRADSIQAQRMAETTQELLDRLSDSQDALKTSMDGLGTIIPGIRMALTASQGTVTSSVDSLARIEGETLSRHRQLGKRNVLKKTRDFLLGIASP